MTQITYPTPKMFPSAFQIIERPLYFLNSQINENLRNGLSWDAIRKLEREIKDYSTRSWESFKSRDFQGTGHYLNKTFHVCKERYASWPHLAAVLAGTAITAPFVIVSTPLTIVADLVIGVAEAAFAKYQRFSSEQIYLILQKKWVASPIQQLTFVGSNLAAASIISLLITWGAVSNTHQFPTKREFCQLYLTTFGLGVFFYRESQKFIGSDSFPKWAKPENFNVFIGGGAPDIDGELFTEKAEKDYQEYKKSQRYSQEQEYDSYENYQEKHDNTGYNYGTSGPSSQPGPSEEIPIKRVRTHFSNILTKLRGELEGENAPAAGSKLKAFYDLVVKTNPLPPNEQEILGITESTESAIKQGFKKRSLIVHPDLHIPLNSTVPDERPIAQILFKVICAARDSLEDNFKMMK